MHRRRHPLRLALISLLSGMLMTGLLIAPGPPLARWAGLETGRFIHEPVREEDTWGAWAIGHTSGWLDEEWTLFYPGSYGFDEPNDPTPPPKLGPLPRWVIRDFKLLDPRTDVLSVSTVATGFPFRAMAHVRWHGIHYPPGTPIQKSTAQRIEGFAQGWHMRNFPGTSASLVIPLRPIWLGLAADVAFWSFASAAVLIGIVQLRCAHRRRRGLCTVCGYNLRGTTEPRCPECWTTSTQPR